MTANSRLRLSAGIIVLSAIYAYLIAQSPQVASAVSSGYIALLLTVVLVTNVWKKP